MQKQIHPKSAKLKKFITERNARNLALYLKDPQSLESSRNQKVNKYSVIETERLVLRPWRMDDIEDLLECLSDYEVVKNLPGFKYPVTREDAQEFIKQANHTKGYGKRFYAIQPKGSNKVIGSTSVVIEDYDAVGKCASGDLWLNSAFQGNGYAKEARYARIKFCFEQLKVRHIRTSFAEDNKASWKMQEPFGTEIYDWQYREYKARPKVYDARGKEKKVKSIKAILTKDSFRKHKQALLEDTNINDAAINWYESKQAG